MCEKGSWRKLKKQTRVKKKKKKNLFPYFKTIPILTESPGRRSNERMDVRVVQAQENGSDRKKELDSKNTVHLADQFWRRGRFKNVSVAFPLFNLTFHFPTISISARSGTNKHPHHSTSSRNDNKIIYQGEVTISRGLLVVDITSSLKVVLTDLSI